METQPYQIRVRQKPSGKIVSHEKFASYSACQDRLDEVEAEYEGRRDIEIEYRDVVSYGPFRR